jgi:hypothetical protein
MNKLADCVGKELEIGDNIVYVPWKGASILEGTVIGATPKHIRCLQKGKTPTTTHTWKGKSYIYWNSTNCKPSQIYKL